MKKLITLFTVSAILFTAIFTGCSKSKAKNTEKITFVLDWTPNTNHTGLYVAQEKGYFEKEGLSVEIIQPSEDSAEMMIAAGRAQFGVSFQDSIAPAFAQEEPLPVTAVAALLQHNTSGIVSLKEKGIDSPAKMEGFKYATWDSPVELATIKKIVERDGGDYSKIQLIPSTVYDVITALNTEIDTVWIFWAWDGVALSNAGYDVNYLDFGKIDPVFDYYTPIMIANNDFLKKNPEAAKKFLKAVAAGYEYAITNLDDAAKILCKAAPELSPELVTASQKWISTQYKADVSQWGFIDSARWNRFYNWLNDEKLVERSIPENFGFTNEYLK